MKRMPPVILSLCIWTFGLALSSHETHAEAADYSYWPSVSRQMTRREGKPAYIVNPRAPSLYMVARDLYGDIHMAKILARWNGLKPDSWLELGQTLRLEKAPSLNEPEGTRALMEQWRKMGNVRMVERLRASLGEEVAPVVAKEPAPEREVVRKPGVAHKPAVSHKPAVAHKSEVAKPHIAHRPAVAHKPQVSNAPAKMPMQKIARKPQPNGKPEAVAEDSPSPARQKNKIPKHQTSFEDAETEDGQAEYHTTHGLKRTPSQVPGASNDITKKDTYWLGDFAEEIIGNISRKLTPAEQTKSEK